MSESQLVPKEQIMPILQESLEIELKNRFPHYDNIDVTMEWVEEGIILTVEKVSDISPPNSSK